MLLILYFDLKHAIQTHDKIIEISGGSLGIRDAGLIESIVELVKNDDYDGPNKLDSRLRLS